MIHAYHVIWGTYGFRLPNDPRGSWSDFVRSWELARFGRATRGICRRNIDPLKWQTWRASAQRVLKFPSVHLSGRQALTVGRGFSTAIRKSGLTIWACSILPEHVHLVIARHTFKAEQMCNLLKGDATKALTAASLHPLASHTLSGKTPSPWGKGQWKVYLDDAQAIESAINYVEANPEKEGKPRQTWSFVTPFAGLPTGWVGYH